MQKARKIILTGGGTAGHVIPNLAILPALQKAGWTAEYIGSCKGIERRLIGGLIKYHPIHSGKLRRYFDIQNFFDLFRIIFGVFQSFIIIGKTKPDVVFSKGGFVSFPVVVAAWLRKVPAVLHEADITPGLANKLSLPFVKRICVSFPETLKYLPEKKAVHTGLPVREQLTEGSREKGLDYCGFTEAKPVLMIMGGSLGAQIINQNIRKTLPELLNNFQVVHICGKGKVDDNYKQFQSMGYRQFEFLEGELIDVFAAAELIISRAGANSIFEIIALNIPNILVPLSAKVSRGDQILNAESFRKQGFSRVLDEDQLNRESLLQTVQEVHQNRELYIKKMRGTSKKNSILDIIAVINEISK